jgi:hypothetical protein
MSNAVMCFDALRLVNYSLHSPVLLRYVGVSWNCCLHEDVGCYAGAYNQEQAAC